MTELQYRADIDGLRAVAVLGVVLFHAGLPWLPGGFIGVDIFFVISGYLITGVLVRDIQNGDYSLLNFYLRRFKRILPALFFVLVFSGFISWFYLLPQELVQYARQMMASLFFVSNILFFKESGYFDVASDFKPLLHTWSLSVEEQFYIVWPLALALGVRHPKVFRFFLLTAISVSFFWACASVVEKPSQVFYLIQGRAWELLLGAALVLFPRTLECRLFFRHIISVLGLIAIFYGYICLSKDFVFPAWNALWPCLGAVMIIMAGKDAVINRHVLSCKPIVFVGLISYSFYLWHWPLLTLLRIKHLGDMPTLSSLVLVLLSFMLAILTWRYVEQPLRHAGVSWRSSVLLTLYAVVTLALFSLAFSVKFSNGFPSRLSQEVIAAKNASGDVNSARSICHLGVEGTDVPQSPLCLTGLKNRLPTVLVWGDSHAEALLPGIAGTSFFAGQTVQQMTKTSCPPLLGVDIFRGRDVYSDCRLFNQAVIRWLSTDEAASIDTVILTARWSVYALESGYGLPDEISRVPTHALVSGAHQISGLRALDVGLGETLNSLKNAGKKSFIVASVPEMRVDVPSCLARKRMMKEEEQDCGLSKALVSSRLSQLEKSFASVENLHDVKVVFPSRVLCPQGMCLVTDDHGQSLYYDHNHLSASGANWLAQRLFTGVMP
ncbi:MAG: acyltransferase [Limnohabitans sp.]|uniref:acyltransferase family protein n=1 Tax=Limnohabitans sp. TaxID=1907725 RepID=UPI0025E96C93|nr:acyltransferase family protein [Limnohabitans sp.]MCO4089685.1 acyltransferase [Limnohabitans sp.]